MIRYAAIRTIKFHGCLSFTPGDAELIVDSVRHIRTVKGTRIVFDLV